MKKIVLIFWGIRFFCLFLAALGVFWEISPLFLGEKKMKKKVPLIFWGMGLYSFVLAALVIFLGMKVSPSYLFFSGGVFLLVAGIFPTEKEE